MSDQAQYSQKALLKSGTIIKVITRVNRVQPDGRHNSSPKAEPLRAPRSTKENLNWLPFVYLSALGGNAL
jgi:hypothetical protein